MTATEFAERVRGPKSGAAWMARCPAHDDREPSLSIRSGNDSRVLLHCHAGCSPEEVVKAAGLRMSDLFPDEVRDDKAKTLKATYDYTTGDGNTLFQVLRYEPKDFRQRRPDGFGGWTWSLKGLERVLYNLPAVASAVQEGRWIFICEGEKDCDTLSARGLVATTNAGGANAPWEPQYTAALRGANVCLIPDNDAPGRRHAETVAESLYRAAKTVKIVELPGLDEKGDVSDWLAQGHTVDDLWALLDAAAPTTAISPRKIRAVAVPLSTIHRKPIQWIWSGWLARGTLTTVAGEPRIGKSTLLAAVATAVTRGAPLPGDTATRQPENVLLLASEDAEAEIVRPRYEDMGADLDRIWVQAGIAASDGMVRPLSLPDDTQDLRDLLDKMRPGLVILDPLVALETSGIDLHRQSAQRAVLAPLHDLATEYQCSIVCVVHLRKGATDNVNHRVAGSIDLVAAARTVLMVGSDPTDPDQRAVAVSKSNLGPRPVPRRFILDAGGFLWVSEPANDLTPETLFGPRLSEDDQERASALSDAMDWLRDFLSVGPRATLDCKAEAKTAAISESTLERARGKLGVKARKMGKAHGNKWVWYLSDTHEPQTDTDDRLDQLPESGAMQGVCQDDQDDQDGQDNHGSFSEEDGHSG